MTGNQDTIDTLKKVTLELEAGTDPDAMDLISEPVRFEFVVGVGTQGLSPFEYRLCGLGAGDQAAIEINAEGRYRFFEHLPVPLPEIPNRLETLYLKARVLAVQIPTNREVVKALAGGSGCGGDCCGHHSPS